MPDWVPYAVIVGVSLALLALTVAAARSAWRKQVRAFVMALLGHRESIAAALHTAEQTFNALAGGSANDMLAFAAATSEERRALGELAARMALLSTDLRETAFPKRLWSAVDALEDAAAALAALLGPLGEGEGEPVLDALATLDRGPARTAVKRATEQLAAVATEYGLTQPAVHGGGFYL